MFVVGYYHDVNIVLRGRSIRNSHPNIAAMQEIETYLSKAVHMLLVSHTLNIVSSQYPRGNGGRCTNKAAADDGEVNLETCGVSTPASDLLMVKTIYLAYIESIHGGVRSDDGWCWWTWGLFITKTFACRYGTARH